MADFNPAQSFSQGHLGGQRILASQRNNQINALQQSVSQQLGQGGFNPGESTEFQQLTGLDPQVGAQILSTFNALEDPRKKAIFEDARKSRQFLEAGNGEGFLAIVSDRLNNIERLGGDPSGTLSILQDFNNGNVQGAIDKLKQTELTGMQATDSKGNPFLTDTRQGGPVSVQSSKILPDGTIIEVLKGGGRQVISPTGEILTGPAAREAVKRSNDQAFNRKKEIARLGQTIRREEAKEGLMNDQQKGIQRGNIQRLGELSKTSASRLASIKKATKFKLALDRGEVQSGAGRIGASFIPGVFTKQAQFDEEFNAFAEIAARQALKASGETRPTDPDVEGMKRAMFGIGRDEQVNITLLTDFINAQNQDTGELDQLIDASKTGNLGGFTFTPSGAAQINVGQLSDEDLFN